MNQLMNLAVSGAKKMVRDFLQRWNDLDLASVSAVIDEASCDICTLIDEPSPWVGWAESLVDLSLTFSPFKGPVDDEGAPLSPQEARDWRDDIKSEILDLLEWRPQ